MDPGDDVEFDAARHRKMHGVPCRTPVQIDRIETFLISPRWLFCRVRVRHRRDHNGRAFAMDVIVLV